MKPFEKDKICNYCLGCNLEENENFEGYVRCSGFVAGKDTKEFYDYWYNKAQEAKKRKRG